MYHFIFSPHDYIARGLILATFEVTDDFNKLMEQIINNLIMNEG